MLALLSRIYGTVTAVRNRLYDGGILRSHKLGSRVISVGNITTGGTGKTPLVLRIATDLLMRGETVCVLTRGYGRQDAGKRVLVADGTAILAGPVVSGDEPYELALRLKGAAVIIADRDRVAAAKWAKQRFEVDTFILDDGFQHRRVYRDIDIVCIDATQPFENALHLPAGRLREHKASLSRAGAIMITRSDTVEVLEPLRAEIRTYAPKARIFSARSEICGIVRLEGFGSEAADNTEIIKDQKVFAFSGLGNPESFLNTLQSAGANLSGHVSFRDHHAYSQGDVADIERKAIEAGAEAVITTAKDAVKLLDLNFEIPCMVVEINMVVDDEEGFQSLF